MSPLLLLQLKNDGDFYALLSAAIRYDASFGDESLLNFPLEQGRIYRRRHNCHKTVNHFASPGNNTTNSKNNDSEEHYDDDFLIAISILHDKQTSNFWKTKFSRRNQAPTRKPLTPSILSGLCMLLRDREHNDNTPPLPSSSQPSLSVASPSATIISLTSSDLVLFTQGLRGQVLRHFKRQRRRRRIFVFVILPPMILLSSLIMLLKTMIQIDIAMVKFGIPKQNGIVCTGGGTGSGETSHTSPGTKNCHFMDTAVWDIVHEHAFSKQTKSITESISHSCHKQQMQPSQSTSTSSSSRVRICNPGKYSMHMRLRNETIPWDQVLREGSSSNKRQPSNENNNGAERIEWGETVVNQLVRQSIQKYSVSYLNNQPLQVLDMGSGLGMTLHSLVPLVVATEYKNLHPQQGTLPKRLSRRHAKKVMLHYNGIGLSVPEVATAQALADYYLDDLKQEGIVNVSFAPGNLATNIPVEPRLRFAAGTYATVLAIESLSYLSMEQIQFWLHAIHTSLIKGGLLMVVDDVVLPTQDLELRTEGLQAALMRPGIISHDEWVDLFEEAGFIVVEARDLTLEYELPRDTDDRVTSANEGLHFWHRYYIRVRDSLIATYEDWMIQLLLLGLPDNNSTRPVTRIQLLIQSWIRLLLLRRTSAASQLRYYQVRRNAYRDAALSYNMYVLKKS